MNRELMMYPKVLKTKEESSNIISRENSVTLDNLNLTEGFAGRKMTQLLNRLVRLEQTRRNIKNIKYKGDSFKKGMTKLEG